MPGVPSTTHSRAGDCRPFFLLGCGKLSATPRPAPGAMASIGQRLSAHLGGPDHQHGAKQEQRAAHRGDLGQSPCRGICSQPTKIMTGAAISRPALKQNPGPSPQPRGEQLGKVYCVARVQPQRQEAEDGQGGDQAGHARPRHWKRVNPLAKPPR